MLRSASIAARRFTPELARSAMVAATSHSAEILCTASSTGAPGPANGLTNPFIQMYGTAGNSQWDTGFGVLRDEKVNVDAQQNVPGSHGFNPAPHPSYIVTEKGADYLEQKPVYTREYVESIQPFHRPPQGVIDNLAYWSIQSVRWLFDVATGYGHGKMTREKWLTRIVFLETVAGVPGMVGGMIRHLHSLRLMQKDRGWIHTLLDEAENERMHLMTFMAMKQPGPIFRGMVLLAQGLYCNLFFLAYIVSPTYCHRLVGYLEEEAVKTYTHAIDDIADGKVPEWQGKEAVPELARLYWRLPNDATVRDLMLVVRADEACHSHVNHTFAGMKRDDKNPFAPASEQTA